MKFPVTQRFWNRLPRPLLLTGLVLTIPAFYLLLAGAGPAMRSAGHLLYGFCAMLMAVDTAMQWRKNRHKRRKSGKLLLDLFIIIACLFSVIPTGDVWATWEWLLRLGLCAAILLRLATLVLQKVKPSHLVQMLGLAMLMLSTAGAGFYWLEPNVHGYADGVWLAFTTIATVGYGDIVPSTPASKIFAVFIVLLGYAMFSIVTANIAALFVEEEEANLERQLHADIRKLSQEVAALRDELRKRG
ncbi:potassium channel family protein [Undibacterium sp. TS12]|uniref:potassium channel family protein n=1 Tax=Undibacterium sp. TS12 TaxID=2908202 RepID=UPI001F4CD01D|nr:potassium channel family protein [Undibacterium sp. TS12]MCH8618871.1 potassium channel family protein [Undibacterium sp. TS12]